MNSNTLLVTETPHRGNPVTWTADSREDFCRRVRAAAIRSDADPQTYDECVEWLAHDLRQLDIVEQG